MESLLATVIPKETIPSLHFRYREVLSSDFERQLRQDKLYRAMIMGNTDKKKVGIVFETTEGLRQVETTVWASVKDNIVLKHGIYIPVCCIKDVII
jgi:hypothetical protein